eukprot:jgi/Tetstr1/439101/TSEL_002966.t1
MLMHRLQLLLQLYLAGPARPARLGQLRLQPLAPLLTLCLSDLRSGSQSCHLFLMLCHDLLRTGLPCLALRLKLIQKHAAGTPSAPPLP